MRQLNDQMMQFERAFVDPRGLPNRPNIRLAHHNSIVPVKSPIFLLFYERQKLLLQYIFEETSFNKHGKHILLLGNLPCDFKVFGSKLNIATVGTTTINAI